LNDAIRRPRSGEPHLAFEDSCAVREKRVFKGAWQPRAEEP
jgi:hypothetical protein